jgi:hypothetical protein
LNQEKKRKEKTFRNVFILAHPISLYKSGAAVWSLNDQLFGKTLAGITPHTPKQGHEIIPTVTAKGRFLGVSNVLTNGVKADGEICAFVFVYT